MVDPQCVQGLGARDCLTMNASSHLALGRTMNSLLERVRTAQQERLKAETDEQRDARLKSMRAARQERLAAGTDEDRDARLESMTAVR